MGGECDPQGIVQEIKIWPYKKVVYAQLWIHSVEWDAQISLGFLVANLCQTTRPSDIKKQTNKKIYCIVDFTILADHKVKLKEGETRDRYLYLLRKLIWLLNVKVAVIPVVVGALGTIPKGLVKGQEDLEIRVQEETIQITSLIRSVRIPRKVLETWGELLLLRLQWKKHQLTLMGKALKGVK